MDLDQQPTNGAPILFEVEYKIADGDIMLICRCSEIIFVSHNFTTQNLLLIYTMSPLT